MLGISHLGDGIFLSQWTAEGLLLFCAASQYVRNAMKNKLFLSSSFYKRRKVKCAKCMAGTRSEIQPTALSFPHSFAQSL